MSLVLDEDEVMLRESAGGFFGAQSPVAALRKLRDERNEAGYDTALWSEMADMGFVGAMVDEEHGGIGLGFRAAGLIAEQMGRNLTTSPFLSTAVLASTALQNSGSDAQKAAWLPKIAAGDAIVALALEERPKHNPASTNMQAARSGNGFKLSGSKAVVLDGHVADGLIVAARTSGEPGEQSGLTLFLVDPKTAGVSTERTIMLDARNAARIEFDDVELTADAVLGVVDEGMDALKPVLNAGRAILAAELLGASTQSFDITLAYIKERKQFGKIVGEFQALQHRSAHLYTELEIARSAVLGALTALDTQDSKAELYCSMAKAKLGQVAKLAALEGIQMHGGVGMTDEYDIGLYLKRIRVAQELFGDEYFQKENVARAASF